MNIGETGYLSARGKKKERQVAVTYIFLPFYLPTFLPVVVSGRVYDMAYIVDAGVCGFWFSHRCDGQAPRTL